MGAVHCKRHRTSTCFEVEIHDVHMSTATSAETAPKANPVHLATICAAGFELLSNARQC